MNDHEVALMLADVLTVADDAMLERIEDTVRRVESFSAGGVLTTNAGFTLYLRDGTEYQVTVVRSH